MASFGVEISLSRVRGAQIIGSGSRPGRSLAKAARSEFASSGLAARNCRNFRRAMSADMAESSPLLGAIACHASGMVGRHLDAILTSAAAACITIVAALARLSRCAGALLLLSRIVTPGAPSLAPDA